MAKALLAYIGLGSNISDPLSQIEQAINAISVLPNTQVVHKSPLYKTAPLGNISQPDFINAAISVTTSLSAIALLRALLEIEAQQGRTREQKWGPRSLDLDLLLYGHEQWRSKQLQLPHPYINERKFVLQPLHDLNPELTLDNTPISSYLAQCSSQKMTEFKPAKARD